MKSYKPKLSLKRALNEAENIEECIFVALEVIKEHELVGELVVVDDGSTDGSAELAAAAGVVHEKWKGYSSMITSKQAPKF